MNNNCCAVVVSYNPSSDILSNVSMLSSQVTEVLVIDNASGKESLDILKTLSQQPSVKVKFNSDNLGIAIALNQGVKYAVEKGYEWIATFDQDSLAPSNFIKTMLDDYESCADRDMVAIVAPRYQMNGSITSFVNGKQGEHFNKIKTTITSGNLVKATTFEKVGLFEDSFFIDYVDHEFCLRVRINGLLIIESQNSILSHNLGNSSVHKIMSAKLVTTGHSPIRRYYKYRNLVTTFRRYYWFEPLLLASQFRSLLVEPIKIIFWESNKKEKIYSIYKGLIDGIMRNDSPRS
jgi:rhamnosyltransferase